MLVPLCLIADRPWTLSPPSAGVVAAVIGVSVFSTALAYILYFRLLRTVGASNLLLVTLLIPVSATLLGVAFLAEHLHRTQIIGAVLIAAGLGAIDGRPWRSLARAVDNRRKNRSSSTPSWTRKRS